MWQIDVGHARGMGDTGARSTIIMVRVDAGQVALEVQRDDAKGGPYTLSYAGTLR